MKLRMHNPPFARAELLAMRMTRVDKLPPVLRATNPKLRGGLALVMVFLPVTCVPFVYVVNATGARQRVIDAWIGKEVALIPDEGPESKPEKPEAVPTTLPLEEAGNGEA